MFQRISNLITKNIHSHLLLKVPHKDNKNLFRFSLCENKFNMFSSITSMKNNFCSSRFFFKKIFAVKHLLIQPHQFPKEQRRTLVKFSWKKGKRQTEKIVPKKFFRLNWGIWIRAMAGCDKKLWKKSRSHRNRLQKIVFCNQTQSTMLDKLVSKYWRKPKYYINDPYVLYHTREEYDGTRKKPWKPEKCDYE